MTMIEKLSAEQEAMLDRVREEWIAVGLSTEPADRQAAEAGVRAAYVRAGMEAPKRLIWVDSPRAGFVVSNRLLGSRAPEDIMRVQNKFLEQVRSQVLDQFRIQLSGRARRHVLYEISSPVSLQVWRLSFSHVWQNIFNGRSWAWRGQDDFDWLSMADAMVTLGVDVDVNGLMQVARYAGWWCALRDIVILTERPNSLHLDAAGRLHHDQLPAVTYPDGWSLWFWHGVPVPPGSGQGRVGDRADLRRTEC